MRPIITVTRSVGAQAGDALLLATRLATLQAEQLVIVPVAEDLELARIRAWARAALPADFPYRLSPIAGPDPELEIHALAHALDAQLLVMGSSPHGPVGRVHLDRWEASAVVHNAPCGIAVAPCGYRRWERPANLLVGVACDGLPESLGPLHSAHALAAAAEGTLRVIAVTDDAEPGDLPGQLAGLHAEVAIDVFEVQGNVVGCLTHASEELDLLVCGSRDRRPLRRLALGRTPLALMRSAACPLVVVAPGTPIPATRRLSA